MHLILEQDMQQNNQVIRSAALRPHKSLAMKTTYDILTTCYVSRTKIAPPPPPGPGIYELVPPSTPIIKEQL